MTAETVRRLGFALAVGAAFAVSPLTSGRRIVPSLVGGALAGAAVLVARRPREPLPFRLSPPGGASRLALGATGVVAAVAFAPTLLDLFQEYTWSIWRNAHGMVLPFLIWEMARARLRHTEGAADSTAWGIVPSLAGVLLVVASSSVGTLQGATMGMLLFAWGFSLITLGSGRTRVLAPALCLCLFLVPLPTSLATPLGLPDLSASGAAWLFRLFGTPVLHEGRYLMVSEQLGYGVTNNCSGFSTFIGGLALASLLAIHTKSRTRALLLLAAPWPLAIATNSIRMTAVVMTCRRFGLPLLNTPLDGISGIATFWAVMGALLLISDRDGLRKGLR